mgnify:CR=1 FL=1
MECFEKGIKSKAFKRALEVEIPEEIYEKLRERISSTTLKQQPPPVQAGVYFLECIFNIISYPIYMGFNNSLSTFI